MFILLSYREDGTSVKKTGDVWRGLIEEATESLGDLVDITSHGRHGLTTEPKSLTQGRIVALIYHLEEELLLLLDTREPCSKPLYYQITPRAKKVLRVIFQVIQNGCECRVTYVFFWNTKKSIIPFQPHIIDLSLIHI